MSRIRGKNTGIELKLRKELHALGFSYRCNSGAVFGHPDVVNKRLKIAIFTDSEFWHGYKFDEAKKNIRTHKKYWIPKIERNIERDKEVNAELQRQGYTVLRYWGHEIEKEMPRVIEEIKAVVEEKEHLDQLLKQKLVKTTLCYLENDGCYLMMHRIKKKNDLNEGKWIGVGGHVEEGESIVACLKREIKEETDLDLVSYKYVGAIDFLNDQYPPERMFLYVGKGKGEVRECDEGVLKWIKKEDIMSLNLWEGDKAFLPLLDKYDEPFKMSLLYEGGELVKVYGPSFKPKKKKAK